MSLRHIRLAGELADRFGATHRLAVSSVAEAVTALEALQPGFRACLRELLQRGLRFRVTVADRAVRDDDLLLISRGDILITPVMVGASSTAMTVVGVALVAVGYFAFGATTPVGLGLMAAGAGMAVGGVVGMMTKIPTGEAVDGSSSGKSSYLIGSGQSPGEQGIPVPAIVGRPRFEPIIISAGIHTEDMS